MATFFFSENIIGKHFYQQILIYFVKTHTYTNTHLYNTKLKRQYSTFYRNINLWILLLINVLDKFHKLSSEGKIN